MRGKDSKLGEPFPKLRLSQDRPPIETFAHIFFSLSGLLLANGVRSNVARSNVASLKCHSTKYILSLSWTKEIFLM